MGFRLSVSNGVGGPLWGPPKTEYFQDISGLFILKGYLIAA
jgi:hypothetical protein